MNHWSQNILEQFLDNPWIFILTSLVAKCIHGNDNKNNDGHEMIIDTYDHKNLQYLIWNWYWVSSFIFILTSFTFNWRRSWRRWRAIVVICHHTIITWTLYWWTLAACVTLSLLPMLLLHLPNMRPFRIVLLFPISSILCWCLWCWCLSCWFRWNDEWYLCLFAYDIAVVFRRWVMVFSVVLFTLKL